MVKLSVKFNIQGKIFKKSETLENDDFMFVIVWFCILLFFQNTIELLKMYTY